MIPNYNEFCKEKDCPEYIEWDCGMGWCVSCKLIGTSYNIDEYPKDCKFINEIKTINK